MIIKTMVYNKKRTHKNAIFESLETQNIKYKFLTDNIIAIEFNHTDNPDKTIREIENHVSNKAQNFIERLRGHYPNVMNGAMFDELFYRRILESIQKNEFEHLEPKKLKYRILDGDGENKIIDNPDEISTTSIPNDIEKYMTIYLTIQDKNQYYEYQFNKSGFVHIFNNDNNTDESIYKLLKIGMEE